MQRAALRKLLFLHIAEILRDLRQLPPVRLEGLKGNRPGHYSIRINDQWRICFTWANDGANNVEIVDYH